MANPPHPPPHPRIALAQRFFARVRTFDMECPHCGEVYQIREGAYTTQYFNRRTARFTCDKCGRTYILGMLAWPVNTSGNSNVPPADQVPGPRQLAQLRTDGDGWWMPDQYKHKGRPDPTNLTGEPDRPEPEDPVDLELIDYDGTDEAVWCEACHRSHYANEPDCVRNRKP